MSTEPGTEFKKRSLRTIGVQKHNDADMPLSTPEESALPATELAPEPSATLDTQPELDSVPATIENRQSKIENPIADALQTGRSYLLIDRYEMALPFFQWAVKNDAENGEAWFQLGLCLNNLKQHAQAADALMQATRLQPENARAYGLLGESCYEVRRGCVSKLRHVKRP